MTTLSDEILVAYADDELPPAERATVERRLAHDAEARDRLQAFTSTGQWLARAYDDTLRAAPPAGMVAAIREAAGETGVSTAGTAAPQPGWRLPGWLYTGPVFGGLGLAAGIALMLAIQPPLTDGPGDAALIAQTLETAVSGEVRVTEIAGERIEITPIGTVRVEDGGICREFTEIRGSGEAMTHGIACRAGDGEWRQVARIDLSGRTGETPGFALAGGNSQALFDALLDGLGTTEVLPPDAERALLEDGWR